MSLEKLIILKDVLSSNIICQFENLTGPVSLIVRRQRFLNRVTVTLRRNGRRGLNHWTFPGTRIQFSVKLKGMYLCACQDFFKCLDDYFFFVLQDRAEVEKERIL